MAGLIELYRAMADGAESAARGVGRLADEEGRLAGIEEGILGTRERMYDAARRTAPLLDRGDGGGGEGRRPGPGADPRFDDPRARPVSDPPRGGALPPPNQRIRGGSTVLLLDPSGRPISVIPTLPVTDIPTARPTSPGGGLGPFSPISPVPPPTSPFFPSGGGVLRSMGKGGGGGGSKFLPVSGEDDPFVQPYPPIPGVSGYKRSFLAQFGTPDTSIVGITTSGEDRIGGWRYLGVFYADPVEIEARLRMSASSSGRVAGGGGRRDHFRGPPGSTGSDVARRGFSGPPGSTGPDVARRGRQTGSSTVIADGPETVRTLRDLGGKLDRANSLLGSIAHGDGGAGLRLLGGL